MGMGYVIISRKGLSLRNETMFHKSKKPLLIWFHTIWCLQARKRLLSSFITRLKNEKNTSVDWI